jgi:hypothetical protein
MEAINPIQNDKQVGQLKGFFSFLVGNFPIMNWNNSYKANANPLSHKAFINIIFIICIAI